MGDIKILKDPIYGYIEISKEYCNSIIDTACFQRLRRIIQTSYSPLYSSSLHNRFVHSIGVFHLGGIASSQLASEIKNKRFLDNNKVESIKETFNLACLLHDVGHAPFSHTGENFYLDSNNANNQYAELHNLLLEAVDSEDFKEDVPQNDSNSAKPHEIMSAIIGLKKFNNLFSKPEERSFFARCITGYKYPDNNIENEIRNCFIQLLNSSSIDVDKLDYLIRDAYSSGFDTVNIDYERLLKAITIVKVVKNDKEHYEFAYNKSAISVLENVIYAHDSEKKWIQNHPVILYESYIMQNIMMELNNIFSQKGKRLFSLESLSQEGLALNENITVRLLSDDDIIFLMKNCLSREICDEYFSRSLRRHPLWKSEAEFRFYFDLQIGQGTVLNNITDAMEATFKYLEKSSNNFKIDKELLLQIDAELRMVEKDTVISQENKDVFKRTRIKIKKLIEVLLEFATLHQIEGDYIIITASQFISGFGKYDFRNALIAFNSDNSQSDVAPASKVLLSFKPNNENDSSKQDEYFYIFYKRKGNAKISCDEFRRFLQTKYIY